MFQFIKNNKAFSIFLSVIVVFMATLGLFAMINDDREFTPPFIEEPNEPDHQPDNPIIEEKKSLAINSFSGIFSDEKNSILFKWNITENNSKIEKIELYKEETLIQTFTHHNEYECSIESYGITTGANIFQLKVIPTKGEPVEKTITVNVNYVFDVELGSKFVNNNLGKGVLLSATYSYHRQTPVGIPTVTMETTLSGYYQYHYLGRNTVALNHDYEKTTIYYFMTFDQTNQTNVTWNIHYNFATVGVSEDDIIVKDITSIVYDTKDIVLPSQQKQE